MITSFTVAHSVTLIASAFGMAPDSLWFPPLIETLIAISIVYMAFENIVGAKLQRRWIVTFAFGLIHGFGFSFLLRERLQFAGDHLVTSLLAFNVGVEIGQLVVLLVDDPGCWSCCSATSSPSASAPSCCRRSSRTPRGTGPSIAARRCCGYPHSRSSRCRTSPRRIRLLMVIVAAAGLVWLVSIWMGSSQGSTRRFNATVQNDRDEPPS